MKDIERRFISGEVRMILGTDGAPARIAGYAAVFNQRSVDLGGFVEIIQPGAFAQSLTEDDVRALFNHDPNMILGRNRANTLHLMEDTIGLRYEITPPDTQYARDLMTSLERGDIDKSSFGFRVSENGDEWEETEEGQIVRTLRSVQVLDVSPVTFPAYPATSSEARSMIDKLRNERPTQARGVQSDVAIARRRLQLAQRQQQLYALTIR